MSVVVWLLLSLAGVQSARQQFHNAASVHMSSSGSHHDWGTGLESGFSVPLLTGSSNSIPASDSRLSPPACLAIPENLTLCQGIGYNQMRLPNLLDHDTMAEVSQQAGSWVPLYNLNCHPDTQLFLCSLFTPVCLDRLIFPCRSLCNAVKSSCESRMQAYGYPWPDMVRCNKFPEDNDMCIGVQTRGPGENSPCNVCSQAETYENLIDNFCRADFVIKTKLKHSNKTQLRCKKAKIFKLGQDIPRKDLRKPVLHHANLSSCCGNLLRSAGKKGHLLIMGKRLSPTSSINSRQTVDDPKYTPTLIMEWGRSKDFRRALKKMRTIINCANPDLISEGVVTDAVNGNRKAPVASAVVRGRGKRRGGKT